MRLPATLLLLLLALGGCTKQRYDTPENAYTSFHELVRREEYKKAYSALSQRTQNALATRAQAVAQASGSAVKADPVAFFFANVPTPPDVTGVSLLNKEGDMATVRVLSSGQSQDVRMVREPSGWKVDLFASLQP